MAQRKKTLMIVDGHALIHRAFHALPPTLRTKDGELVNAVYGFTMILLKALSQISPEYAAVTFDLPGGTWRDEIFKEYKAQRVKPPEELYRQIPRVKEVVRALNIPIYEKIGYEADDVLATLSDQYEKYDKNAATIIVTGDMDTLQLVDRQTSVFTLRKGMSDTRLYDTAGVRERYGLKPAQLVDFKALAGDASDNLPGVRGIGPKTATELLQKYGTLENIYKKITGNKEQVTKRIKEKLLKYEADAWQSQALARVVRDVPEIKLNLDDCYLRHYDRAKAVKLFQQLQFQSLLKSLPPIAKGQTPVFDELSGVAPQKLSAPSSSPAPRVVTLINNPNDFADFLKKLKQQKYFVFDVETERLDSVTGKLCGISFCWEAGRAYYVVPFVATVWSALKPIFSDRAVAKGGHNAKYDISVLANAGLKVKGLVDDSMVISYLLDPGTRAHNLNQLAFTELGEEMTPIEDLIGKGKDPLTFDRIPLAQAAEYSGADAEVTFRLIRILKAKLSALARAQLAARPFCAYRQTDKKLWNASDLYRKIELPLIEVLTDMERAGIKLDGAVLNQAGREFSRRIAVTEKTIYRLAGQEFNISSPAQLRKIIFEKLNLGTNDIKKTKTGYSTAASELEKLRSRHKVVDEIFVYRELSKLKNTYLDSLPRLINKKTGRLHTSFNQTVTATGRLSSSNPNLQNIPIKSAAGQKIRRAFVAAPGYRLVSLDYSQIDLRVLAHFSRDSGLRASFQKGEDIHSAVAARIFNKSRDQVQRNDRRIAKVVNFGIVYGMSAFGLSQTLRVERGQAKEYIERYFEKHPRVRQYMKEMIAFAKQHGYVETLLGRRRNLPEINSSQFTVRGSAERMAINMPIQGTASDIVKLAMIAVATELKPYGSSARMLLQVHDELLLEVKKDRVAAVIEKSSRAMERAVQLSVPLKVNAETGKNWGEME